jgi:hypothetical protein
LWDLEEIFFISGGIVGVPLHAFVNTQGDCKVAFFIRDMAHVLQCAREWDSMGESGYFILGGKDAS